LELRLATGSFSSKQIEEECMKKVRDAMQVALAMVLAAVLAVGLAGTVKGQIVHPGDIDLPAVTVVQRPTPNTTVSRGSLVTYDVEVRTNRSNGVGNVFVQLHYNPGVAQLMGAEFIQLELNTLKESKAGDAWVSQRNDGIGSLTFQTGRVSNDKAIIGKISFYVKMDAPDGASVMERLSFEWVDEHGNRELGLGNQPILTVGNTDVHQEHYPITVEPMTAPTGSKRVFMTEPIYAPGEPVAIWYNHPNGVIIDVGAMAADYNGRVRFELDSWNMGNGTYSMVTQGNWTHFTSVSVFHVGQPPAAAQPEPQPPQGADAAGKPGCMECHAVHNVMAPHSPRPNCTECHGESKPPLEKGCVECHSSPAHQAVVMMPHPPQPNRSTDQPCIKCHGEH